MKKLTLIALALVALALSACGGQTTGNAAKVRSQDVNNTAAQVLRLRKNEPLPVFNDSAALHVQDSYYTADADPNKIWYVTLVALDGTPYAHFTTRGAPQPAGDQVTNPVQQVCAGGSNGDKNCDVIGLPEPNGVHESGATPGYIAILTTGALIRIPENAVISDQPFAVSAPVKLSIDETAQISHTDVSATRNPVVPAGSGTRK